MNVLAFDTATAATAVAAARAGEPPVARRHDPAPGERPGHASRLLGLIEEALAGARLDWGELDRIAVGVGPGTFTGLRIGVATARALAQAREIPLAAISTLRALADAAEREPPSGDAGGDGAASRPVLAVVDARRGELFAAAWHAGRELLAPAALAPDALAERIGAFERRPLAIGDGAVEFRYELERAGALVPEARSQLHLVTAASHCRLAPSQPVVERAALLPSYLRLPDAEIAHRQRQ